MPRTVDSGFAAAVLDREDQPVALIQVKANPVGHRWASVHLSQLAKLAEQVEFVLTIDPVSVYLYRTKGENSEEPIVHLDTPQVLQHYDPEFSKRRVFESYLLTLVEAWLRDLAYHWKSESPPGSEELRRAGLLGKLEGGTTQPLGA